MFTVSWASTLYIHFRGLFPDGILPGAIFTVRPSLEFSYIGSVTARHSSRGMELWNFCRGRHLCSAGRPSGWALAHILVLSFFLAYSQQSEIGCLPYFHTWCGLSVNLESGLKCAACDSLKIQDAKKSPKIRHLGTIAQICQAVSSQLKHVSALAP